MVKMVKKITQNNLLFIWTGSAASFLPWGEVIPDKKG